MQCPNCKFYKVDSEARESVTPTGTYSNPKTGDAFLTVVTTIVIWIIGCIVAAIVGFFVAVIIDHLFMLRWTLDTAGEWAKIFVAIWTLGCLVVGIWIVARLLDNKGTHYATKHLGYSHYCRHCGYAWDT
jgi:hypothetical protein